MSTFSEEILSRYRKTEIETDAFGRAITVGRLKPFDAMRIRRIMGAEDRGVLTEFMVAASVRSVSDDEGRPLAFAPPKDESDLQAIMNYLDDEGFAAAAKAYVRLYGFSGEGEADKPEGADEGESTLDKAKN